MPPGPKGPKMPCPGRERPRILALVSRAPGCGASRVSMSSDYVRLSGQGKCPSRPLSYHRTVIRGTCPWCASWAGSWLRRTCGPCSCGCPTPWRLRLGGDGDHLCPAGLEGLLAVPVGAGDDAGLLAAVPAGAGGGVKQVGEGHSLTLLLSRIVLLQRES